MDIIPGVSLHARQRMMERHGFDPSREDWERVVLEIIDRRALLMGRHHKTGRERFRVLLGGMQVEVWWSPDCAQIVTVMPRDAVIALPIKKGRSMSRTHAYERERRRPRLDVEDFA